MDISLFNHENNMLDTLSILDALDINGSMCKYHHKIDKTNDWEFVCLYLPEFNFVNDMEIYRILFQFTIIYQLQKWLCLFWRHSKE
jgi:hypothetical protein